MLLLCHGITGMPSNKGNVCASISHLSCTVPFPAFLLFVLTLGLCQFSPSLFVCMVSNPTRDIPQANPWERSRWDSAHCQGMSQNLHFLSCSATSYVGVGRVLIPGVAPFLCPDYWCTLMSYGQAVSAWAETGSDHPSAASGCWQTGRLPDWSALRPLFHACLNPLQRQKTHFFCFFSMPLRKIRCCPCL